MDEFAYFDHDADIGIVGKGSTLEYAFESAAKAMFAIMAEELSEPLKIEVSFTFEEEDTEFALIRWLNYLLAHAQSRSIILGRFELRREGALWHTKAWGVPWSQEIVRGVEVKGATLTMLSVEERDGHWEARCIVDV
ncbi:MAG: archease [Campylobacterota bacterium]|nr:archease [Campylobacterota bacterium]